MEGDTQACPAKLIGDIGFSVAEFRRRCRGMSVTDESFEMSLNSVGVRARQGLTENLRADPSIREYLQQDRMRHPAVDNVGFPNAAI